jgi:FeS assembly protein IscX
MPTLTWNDLEDIALALSDKYPEQDPAFIRFTDLYKWVTELENFGDDPNKSNEAKLEAIQMAWLDEYKDNRQ